MNYLDALEECFKIYTAVKFVLNIYSFFLLFCFYVIGVYTEATLKLRPNFFFVLDYMYVCS